MHSFIIQLIVTVITSSVTVAVVNTIYLNASKAHKLCALRQLYFDTYIQPIEQQIDSLLSIKNSTGHFSKNYTNLMNTLGKDATSIKYTLENEYKYLNNNYVFEIVRLAEFTRSTEAICQNQLAYYEFVSPTLEGDILAQQTQINNLNKCKTQLKNFQINAKQYMALKIEIIKKEDK